MVAEFPDDSGEVIVGLLFVDKKLPVKQDPVVIVQRTLDTSITDAIQLDGMALEVGERGDNVVVRNGIEDIFGMAADSSVQIFAKKIDPVRRMNSELAFQEDMEVRHQARQALVRLV